MGERASATSGVTLAFTVIATVFVAARFYTRAFLVKSIKLDDWWMLGAWLLAVAFSAAICVAVKYGLGRHAEDILPHHFTSLRKSQYAFSVLYNPALMLTKNSIIAFYLSVMSKDVDVVFKWCNYITLAVVNVAGLALTLLNIFQCSPVRAGYTYPTPAGARCTDIVILYLSSAPVNIITDLAILFLPMPILTGMRLPKKQKMILIVTFSVGAFVAVVDVIRVAYLQNASLARLAAAQSGTETGRTVDDSDFSWYASLGFMWSAVEVDLGVICACVPALKPLFIRFLPQFVKDSANDSLPGSMGESINEGNGSKSKSVPTGNQKTNSDSSMLTNPAAFRRPTVKEYSGDDDGDNMGFLNFLEGPQDEAPRSPIPRTSTRISARLKRSSTKNSTASDFDFVRMDKDRNMLKLSNRKSVWPVAVVTVIFFLWGFAYGLLAALNSQFQAVAGLDQRQSLALNASYWAGYLVGPLSLGRFMLKRYGFKASMMAGLCVYGCGTLIFWPSAVLTSFVAFLISNFIVASGLSCLEIAANPYIALCGPLEYAEVRLNLSQAFQAVGTVCSPLLANRVLFKNVQQANALVDVQWAYLGIALFVIGLAVVFYYIPLPEATDEQLAELADRRSAVNRARVGKYQVVWVTLVLAAFSQWVYVGAQENIGGNTEALMGYLLPNHNLTPSDLHTVGHTVFAIGRFMSAFLNYLLTPRWILMGLYTGTVVCTGLLIGLKGEAAAAVQMLVYFFEAGIFAIIFAISMRGMGAHTKTGAAIVTAAISGGGVFPAIQWAAGRSRGLQFSYVVPTVAFSFGMLFPIYLNLVPQARRQVDPVHEDRVARRQRRAQRQGSNNSDPEGVRRQFGLKGIIARRKKAKAEQAKTAMVEHIEDKNAPGLKLNTNVNLSGKNQSNKGFADSGLNEKSTPITLESPRGQVGELEPWNGSPLSPKAKAAQQTKPQPAHTKQHPSEAQNLSPFTGAGDSTSSESSTSSSSTSGSNENSIGRYETASQPPSPPTQRIGPNSPSPPPPAHHHAANDQVSEQEFDLQKSALDETDIDRHEDFSGMREGAFEDLDSSSDEEDYHAYQRKQQPAPRQRAPTRRTYDTSVAPEEDMRRPYEAPSNSSKQKKVERKPDPPKRVETDDQPTPSKQKAVDDKPPISRQKDIEETPTSSKQKGINNKPESSKQKGKDRPEEPSKSLGGFEKDDEFNDLKQVHSGLSGGFDDLDDSDDDFNYHKVMRGMTSSSATNRRKNYGDSNMGRGR